MKKPLLPLLCLACLLLALPGCQDKFYNDDVYDNLIEKSSAYAHGKFSADELLALCDQALNSPAANDPKCLAVIYSSRGLVFMEQGDFERAEIEARKAIAAAPDHIFGWSILADVFGNAGRMAEAADALEQALTVKNILPGSAEEYQQSIKEWREAAKIITPDALDAAFAADETEATKKYDGLLLTIQGKITDLDFESWEETFLIFAGSGPKREVICSFMTNTHERYSHLKPGQTVTVFGVCNGMLEGYLVISGCKLLNVAP